MDTNELIKRMMTYVMQSANEPLTQDELNLLYYAINVKYNNLINNNEEGFMIFNELFDLIDGILDEIGK